MSTVSLQDLVDALRKRIATVNNVARVRCPKDVDELVGRGGTIEFLWMDGVGAKCEKCANGKKDRSVEPKCRECFTDPAYEFWRLQNAKKLAELCFVVFTDAKEGDIAWNDMQKVYGGVLLGDMYLMRCNGTRKPQVVPSQHGMFLK
jgi:hypothetical protein